MINQKPKPCKAIGKARGFESCGKLSYQRKYGLCQACLKNWLLNTPEGQEVLNKHSLKAKGTHEKEQKQSWNAEKKQRKVDLMSKDEYRATYIQPLINELARLIDYGQPCIATGNFNGKMAGGHRHSVGSNRTLALNLHNIHNQSFHSNSCQGGDHLRYRLGVIQTYGEEYADFIDHKLNQCPALHITKQDLIDAKPILNAFVRQLKKAEMKYPKKMRIRLRNEINAHLGFYPEEYAVFKNK